MQHRFAAIFAAALFAVPMSAGLAAPLEKPKTVGAQVFLGPTVIGPNYKVKPQAGSDGMMRLFTAETPYGEFQFDGVEFTKMRLRELDAVAALEKMSQSDRFMSSLGRAAFAPVKFGADLITNPVETINRSMSGVANMFDRTGAGLANTRSDRDNLVESLLGVSDTQRELAVELGVDPYTDFPPLATRLKQMAGAMASGGLPVKAGLALIPGGAGIAVSSVAGVGNAKDTLRSKTPAQLIAETRGNLQKLGVPDSSTDQLVENRNYTPADLLLMSRALVSIGAQDSVVFVDDAAKANTRDLAFYQRRLAELMAARGDALGGLAAFTVVAGHVVNVSRSGAVVAVFPLDDVAWTELLRGAFLATSAQLRSEHPGGRWTFATTGAISPMATEQIKKLGWKIVQLKPLP